MNPSTSPSDAPSDSPSLEMSAMPSALPSFDPSSLPSTRPSLRPSGAPSVSPSTFPSDFPSLVPSTEPSSGPSVYPTAFGEVQILESVHLKATQGGPLSTDTIAVFENVCEQKFLPWYLPRLFAAEYEDIKCEFISQTENDGRRNLAKQDEDAKLQLTVGTVAVLFRVKARVELPDTVLFSDICKRTFSKYADKFQSFLHTDDPWFEKADTNVAGIVTDITQEPEESLPLVIVLVSALTGATMAIGVAVLFIRRIYSKSPATPPRDITDDSVLLLFDKDNIRRENRDDPSFNPYLPPTPMGIGVPTEIGPDSWIEPDDELSAASPDNESGELAQYVGGGDPFGFDKSAGVISNILQSQSDADSAPQQNNKTIVPQSRAAQILASLTSGESFRNPISEIQLATRSYPLETVQSHSSEDAEDDDTKPTLSSRGSQPTKSSSNTGPSSRSDGSSTLHGLKLVGTMSVSSFSGSNPKGSGPVATDYDSDPSYEKKTFFRKVMKRKAPPAKGQQNMKYEFSNNTNNVSSHRRLTLPKAAPALPAESRQDNLGSPRKNKSSGARENIVSSVPKPPADQGTTLQVSKTDSSPSQTSKQSSLHSLTPSQVGSLAPGVKISNTNSTVYSTTSGLSVPSKATTVKTGTARAKRNNNAQARSGSLYGNSLKKRPVLQEPVRFSGHVRPGSGGITSPSAAPTPQSQAEASEISVDPRRAAGTPTTEKTLRRYEECTIRSPVESFVRKNETPKGTRFLQMSTDSAQHTGNVLEDLGRLEDEWDGQLESKLSATATTPRHTNSEKFRKAPRQHIYRDDMV